MKGTRICVAASCLSFGADMERKAFPLNSDLWQSGNLTLASLRFATWIA